MKSWKWLIVAFVLVGLLSFACNCALAADEPGQKTWGQQEQQTSQAKQMPAVMGQNVGIGPIERRRLGLTLLNLAKVGAQLKKDGVITEESTRAEIAAAIMSKMAEDPKWSENAKAIDWDSVLNFIEQLIPLILKLIEIFGAL